MVATVESGEQDTVLKVLQIYNQEVSERQTSASRQLLLFTSLEAGWPCCGISVPPGSPQSVSSERICLRVTAIKMLQTASSFTCRWFIA